MIKSLVALLFALSSAAAFAALDVNKASLAELEAIKGIGPTVAQRILDERSKTPFADWSDMQSRVKGVGQANAAKFSTGGLTVNGNAYAGASTTAAPGGTRAVVKAGTKADKGDATSGAKKATAKP